jgi:hypothetical protein
MRQHTEAQKGDPVSAVARPPELAEREKLLWCLARRLFEIMEHLDPGPPGDGDDDLDTLWDSLSEREKRFYFLSLFKFLGENGELLRIVHVNSPQHHVV